MIVPARSKVSAARVQPTFSYKRALELMVNGVVVSYGTKLRNRPNPKLIGYHHLTTQVATLLSYWSKVLDGCVRPKDFRQDI